MSNEPIQVVFCIDKGYAQHLAAAVASLFAHNNDVDVHVIVSELSPADAESLDATARTFGGRLNFLDIDPERVAHLHEFLHLSRAAYYRLFIPHLLPHLSKAIYLDCDLVVETDLRELWETDVSGYALAGWDECNPKLAELFGIGDDCYINSGVLVFNSDYWRAHDLTNRCLQWLEANPKRSPQLDQDAINVVLKGLKLPLERRWNLNPLSHENFTILKEGVGILDRYPQRILHFAGPIKPWHKCYDFDLAASYWKYLALTPWRHQTCSEPGNCAQALSVANQYHARNDHFQACRYYQAAVDFRVKQRGIESTLVLDCINGGHGHFNEQDYVHACEHYRSCMRFWGYPLDHDAYVYRIPGII